MLNFTLQRVCANLYYSRGFLGIYNTYYVKTASILLLITRGLIIFLNWRWCFSFRRRVKKLYRVFLLLYTSRFGMFVSDVLNFYIHLRCHQLYASHVFILLKETIRYKYYSKTCVKWKWREENLWVMTMIIYTTGNYCYNYWYNGTIYCLPTT